MLFKNYLFSLLPVYFKREDTNKDNNGEGTLERYMQIFGEELDDEVIPKLENILDIVDANTTPSNLINTLSDTLGNPPDIFLDEALYRKLLRYVSSIYKIKGTAFSYQVYFGLLGYNATILELPPDEEDYYDTGILYDTLAQDYDEGCKECSDYYIILTKNDDPLSPVDQTTLDKLHSIVYFVEPINANLLGLQLAIGPSDDVNFCLEQEVKISTYTVERYDQSHNYDTGILYDATQQTNILTLPFDCQASLPQDGISIWALEDDFEVQ